ncbi:hypothetical protein FACS1894211_11900 [Clostridia bacterium]|nr:hypothetical protein FACS1894211_11900 [Clostridia bacterium]
MDKFGMYKKIPAPSVAPDEKTLNEAHDYTAAPDYAAGRKGEEPAKSRAAGETVKTNGTPPTAGETPEQVARRIAAANANGTQESPRKKAVTPALRAYLDMQRRHARLSEEIDRKNKS